MSYILSTKIPWMWIFQTGKWCGRHTSRIRFSLRERRFRRRHHRGGNQPGWSKSPCHQNDGWKNHGKDSRPRSRLVETLNFKFGCDSSLRVFLTGVNVVPGSPGPVSNVQEALEFCKEHGMPVIFKAAYGGGGRGMRKVNNIEVSESSIFWILEILSLAYKA